MLIGAIADDFTGASDIANTLAKGLPGEGGLRTAQFPGLPEADAPKDVDAGVIALKSRSAPVREAVDQSLAALRWFLAQGCRQIVFKVCSTFDSTPAGNIGPVAEAIAAALGTSGVVVCPAFPTAGRTVYQGHLFVHDRLLSESGMQDHPLTPMTDPDIRRWLARQATAPVGHVPQSVVSSGAEGIATALAAQAATGHVLTVVDATGDGDLLAIGAAVADVPFLTGGSGVAIGLPRNVFAKGLARPDTSRFSGIEGPEAILAGSCSGATRDQIGVHAQNHPVFPIDVAAVMEGHLTAPSLVAFIAENTGRAPLVYSSGAPEQVRAFQDRFGPDNVAHRLDALFADTARALVSRGTRRIVVAGGETSGAVASALGVPTLLIGPEIDPGVPVLIAEGRMPLALALKSGNFGAPDFYAKALRIMAGGT